MSFFLVEDHSKTRFQADFFWFMWQDFCRSRGGGCGKRSGAAPLCNKDSSRWLQDRYATGPSWANHQLWWCLYNNILEKGKNILDWSCITEEWEEKPCRHQSQWRRRRRKCSRCLQPMEKTVVGQVVPLQPAERTTPNICPASHGDHHAVVDVPWRKLNSIETLCRSIPSGSICKLWERFFKEGLPMGSTLSCNRGITWRDRSSRDKVLWINQNPIPQHHSRVVSRRKSQEWHRSLEERRGGEERGFFSILISHYISPFSICNKWNWSSQSKFIFFPLSIICEWSPCLYLDLWALFSLFFSAFVAEQWEWEQQMDIWKPAKVNLRQGLCKDILCNAPITRTLDSGEIQRGWSKPLSWLMLFSLTASPLVTLWDSIFS